MVNPSLRTGFTRRSSGVAPRADVRVYARVLVPPNLYIHTYIRRVRAMISCIYDQHKLVERRERHGRLRTPKG